MYARTVDPERERSFIDEANYWHRDSIGMTVKAFLCLATTGSGVGTQIIKGVFLIHCTRMGDGKGK